MTLVLVSLFLFLLGQVGRLSFNQQEINLYLYEIPYFSCITYLLIKRPKYFKISKSTIILLGTLFFTYLLGFFKISVYGNLVSILYLIRFTFYILGFGLVANFLSKKTFSFNLLIIFMALLSAAGFLQYFLYDNLRNLQYLGWDPHQSRIFGQFLDTSVAGAIYGLILIFIVLNQKLFPKIISLIFTTIYSLIALFTYSRGFLVSILSSAVGYSLMVKKNWEYLILIAEFVLIFFAFAPTPFGEGVKLMRTSTIESRVVDYEKGFKLWQKNPIFGIGYNRIRYFKPVIDKELRGASHAGASFHSSFLIILTTTGVIGLFAFCYWLWTITKFGSFALISTIFLCVYSLFDNILLHPFILFLWPILIGVSTSRKKQ